MHKLGVVLVIILFLDLHAHAQRKWSLRECVEYGVAHNNSLKTADINTRLAELQQKQSMLSRYPSASANIGAGVSSGRSIDPTSNQFVNSNYWFGSGGASSSVLLFGWFQKNHEISSNNKALESTRYNQAAIQDDISLNIATAFLRALLAKKQISIAEQQIGYSVDQMTRTALLVEAGAVPEINLLQIKSQLAQDSSNYIQTNSNYIQSILQLKALMNLPFGVELDIKDPYIDGIELNRLLPSDEELIEMSLRHRNNIRANELNLESAYHSYKSTKAMLYPSLSFGLTYGTNYASIAQEFAGIDTNGVAISPYFFYNNQGLLQNVYTVDYDVQYKNTPLLTQLRNNNRFTFSLNVSIPIFNGWSAQAASRRAKLNYESQQITLDQAKQQLSQDVLMAKSDAINSFQIWQSSEKALETAKKSFDLAKRRYEIGLMNTLEFQLEKNNLYSAEVQSLSNKYDYIFKYKVLDFYLGNKIW